MLECSEGSLVTGAPLKIRQPIRLIIDFFNLKIDYLGRKLLYSRLLATLKSAIFDKPSNSTRFYLI